MKSKIEIIDTVTNEVLHTKEYEGISPLDYPAHKIEAGLFGASKNIYDFNILLEKDEKALILFMGSNMIDCTVIVNIGLCATYSSTQNAIDRNDRIIFTTQPHFCNSTVMIDKEYRIFVYMLNDEMIEIKMGSDNKYTKREIRYTHNLEKLLLANEFGQAISIKEEE